MKCPICGEQSKVMESRDSGKTIIRRRKCKACSQIFYTEEVAIDYYDGCQKISKIARERYKDVDEELVYR